MMMEPEDFGGRRHVSHTPTIAISVAVVLSLAMGAMSYRDFVRNRYEKEFAEKEQRLLSLYGQQPVAGMPGMPAQAQPPQPLPPAPAPAATAQQNSDPRQASLLAHAASQRGVEAALPTPNDPELEQLRSSLDQAREQGQRVEQRFREISGSPSAMQDAPTAAAPSQSQPLSTEGIGDLDQLPAFLRDAVENPPGGNPDVEDRLSRMKEQVRLSPSLAKVTGYDSQWGIVTFNAGAAHGVEKDKRFAVRRGDEVLGWVKVDHVGAEESSAYLVTKNRDSDTALKPAVGDDLIDFELF